MEILIYSDIASGKLWHRPGLKQSWYEIVGEGDLEGDRSWIKIR